MSEKDFDDYLTLEEAFSLGGELDDVMVTLDSVCQSCRHGFHDECDEFWVRVNEEANNFEWVSCCCGGNYDLHAQLRKESKGSADSNYVGTPVVEEIETYINDYIGVKSLDEYADPLSSGRKMAAKTAPIAPGMICEWAWLAQAGGGVVPILGCPGRPASDRHHGPDKNTLNNELGVNLHRICDWCHNQWHAKNDEAYGPRPTNEDGSVDASVPFIPDGDYVEHDPTTRAKDEEIYAEDGLRREEARKHGADI